MNQFFYESRGKEKVKDLMNEGMTNQALHRTKGRSRFNFGRFTMVMFVVLILAGLLAALIR